MDDCFPLRTYRIKADDPPWMTHGLRKMIERRKAVFETDKKCSSRWKNLKKLTDKLLKQKKAEYVEAMKQIDLI